MIIASLKKLFVRDLKKLQQEIALYKSETDIWRTDKAITNPAGNLCLHLVGNLNHFVGTILGKTDYVRNRDAEFESKNIPVATLLQQIEETINVVETTLDKIDDQQLSEEYPLVVFQEKMTTGFFLIHLSSHLGYHLGQVNYHRRLLDN